MNEYLHGQHHKKTNSHYFAPSDQWTFASQLDEQLQGQEMIQKLLPPELQHLKNRPEQILQLLLAQKPEIINENSSSSQPVSQSSKHFQQDELAVDNTANLQDDQGNDLPLQFQRSETNEIENHFNQLPIFRQSTSQSPEKHQDKFVQNREEPAYKQQNDSIQGHLNNQNDQTGKNARIVSINVQSMNQSDYFKENQAKQQKKVEGSKPLANEMQKKRIQVHQFMDKNLTHMRNKTDFEIAKAKLEALKDANNKQSLQEQRQQSLTQHENNGNTTISLKHLIGQHLADQERQRAQNLDLVQQDHHCFNNQQQLAVTKQNSNNNQQHFQDQNNLGANVVDYGTSSQPNLHQRWKLNIGQFNAKATDSFDSATLHAMQSSNGNTNIQIPEVIHKDQQFFEENNAAETQQNSRANFEPYNQGMEKNVPEPQRQLPKGYGDECLYQNTQQNNNCSQEDLYNRDLVQNLEYVKDGKINVSRLLQRSNTSFMDISNDATTKNSQPDLLGIQYQGLSNHFEMNNNEQNCYNNQFVDGDLFNMQDQQQLQQDIHNENYNCNTSNQVVQPSQHSHSNNGQHVASESLMANDGQSSKNYFDMNVTTSNKAVTPESVGPDNHSQQQQEKNLLKNLLQEQMHQELRNILQQQLKDLNIGSLQDLQQMLSLQNRDIFFQELQNQLIKRIQYSMQLDSLQKNGNINFQKNNQQKPDGKKDQLDEIQEKVESAGNEKQKLAKKQAKVKGKHKRGCQQSRNSSSLQVQVANLHAYHRNLEWDLRRKSKIEKMRESQEQSKLEGCTFKPKRESQNSSINNRQQQKPVGTYQVQFCTGSRGKYIDTGFSFNNSSYQNTNENGVGPYVSHQQKQQATGLNGRRSKTQLGSYNREDSNKQKQNAAYHKMSQQAQGNQYQYPNNNNNAMLQSHNANNDNMLSSTNNCNSPNNLSYNHSIQQDVQEIDNQSKIISIAVNQSSLQSIDDAKQLQNQFYPQNNNDSSHQQSPKSQDPFKMDERQSFGIVRPRNINNTDLNSVQNSIDINESQNTFDHELYNPNKSMIEHLNSSNLASYDPHDQFPQSQQNQMNCSSNNIQREKATILSQSHIQRHLIRMEQARINRECKQIMEDLKPGSGKIWQNKLTRPTVPKLTGLRKGRSMNTTLDRTGRSNLDCQTIESLKRPINTPLASYTSRKKRHKVYVKEKQLKERLTRSNSLLRHYLSSVDRKKRDNNNMSVLEQLGKRNMYRYQELLPPECQSVITKSQRSRSQIMKQREKYENDQNKQKGSRFRKANGERSKKQVISRHRDPVANIQNVSSTLDVSKSSDLNHFRTKITSSKIKNSKLMSKGQQYCTKPEKRKEYTNEYSIKKPELQKSASFHNKMTTQATSKQLSTKQSQRQLLDGILDISEQVYSNYPSNSKSNTQNNRSYNDSSLIMNEELRLGMASNLTSGRAQEISISDILNDHPNQSLKGPQLQQINTIYQNDPYNTMHLHSKITEQNEFTSNHYPSNPTMGDIGAHDENKFKGSPINVIVKSMGNNSTQLSPSVQNNRKVVHNGLAVQRIVPKKSRRQYSSNTDQQIARIIHQNIMDIQV